MAINGATSVDLPSFEPEERNRRFRVLGLRPGDQVRVPYSLAPEDLVEMTVDMIRRGWLYLVPHGKAACAENYVKACAVNGWTVPFGIKLVPAAPAVSEGGDNAAL